MAGPGAEASGAAASEALGEDSLISRYFKPLATDPGAFGLIDDAATFNADGDDVVVNTDAIVAGVHFLPDDPPDTIARKALRVNLSDLAAKGATPTGFVLTLALPTIDEAWLAGFAAGLGEDIATFGCALLGGDTVSTPGPLMVSVTAFGRVPKGKIVRRAGAAAGDLVYVTGTIGDAALGLRLLTRPEFAKQAALTESEFKELVQRYRVPQPRNQLAATVVDYATASMDVSDGLAGDLSKLCGASGVSAVVTLARVPVSGTARLCIERGGASLESLLTGGDDYEVLCTVSPVHAAHFEQASARLGLRVSMIGEVTAGAGKPVFLDSQGDAVPLSRLSYSHF